MSNEMQRVAVLAGIRLAASDCRAQGNIMASNDLLGIAVAVSQLFDDIRAMLVVMEHDGEGDSAKAAFLRAALVRVGASL